MLLFRRQYATYFEGSQEKLYFDYVYEFFESLFVEIKKDTNIEI